MEKEINKFHALQLFTDTFAAETVHLTNSQIGIYIRLLCFAWTKNAKPFTTESAFRICQCRTDDCHIEVYEILEEFFKVERECDDRNKKTWTHKRLVQEHNYLINKYKRRSEAGKKGGLAKRDNATSKNVAPIPSPSPIPNNNIYEPAFEKLWSLLNKKKGSKFKAHQLFQKLWIYFENDLEDVARIYNNQIKGIEDDKFVPHFSTWLSQRRWEIEDNNEDAIKSITQRLINLGYTHNGRDKNYERFSKDGKKYKIDINDEKNMIIPDE